MYRHLLVPLDGTELSMSNVSAAVQFAGAIGARITFFHAMPDVTAHPAALRRPGSGKTGTARPSLADFQARTQAASRALIAKACAAAAAHGAPYDTLCVVDDHPSEAIVRAAQQCGCDLIVMASHGVSGLRMLTRPSQTLNVVRETKLPVLVTRVQATDRHAAASRAVALIQDEHRSLSAVIQGMLHLVADARGAESAGFDRSTFERLLHYAVEFPEKHHYPSEERTLYRLLRERGDQDRELIQALEAHHVDEHGLVGSLRRAVAATPAGVRVDSGSDLATALDALAAHEWDHMRLEEYTLIPLALEVLTEAEWAEVACAFEKSYAPGHAASPDDAFDLEFASIAGSLKLPIAHPGPARD
ncbi:MAG: universal stress protein [Burkholderiales bacterium]|nr:MAG: universal stress protein [Burkholderiales bacterium]